MEHIIRVNCQDLSTVRILWSADEIHEVPLLQIPKYIATNPMNDDARGHLDALHRALTYFGAGIEFAIKVEAPQQQPAQPVRQFHTP